MGAPSIVAGNVSHIGTNANNFTLRNSGGFGNVTGSISYGTGTVALLDTTNWQFSNASNTWGTLTIDNAGATAFVGATNALSATGVVTSNTTGTLKLNNLNGSTAFSQRIGGLSAAVKVGLTTGSATLTLNNSTALSHSGVISGAISLVEAGSATQTLSGTNTYTGTTSVTSGTLLVSGAINGTTSLGVTGGTFQLGQTNAVKTTALLTLGGGTFNAAGFSQTLGTLTLAIGSSTLDFGAGNAGGIITLSDSVATSWAAGATLSITDWNGSSTGGGSNQLLFTNTAGGLSAGQIADLSFVNPAGFAAGTYPAQALPLGGFIEIVPVPEPSALWVLLGGASVVGLGRWRRK